MGFHKEQLLCRWGRSTDVEWIEKFVADPWGVMNGWEKMMNAVFELYWGCNNPGVREMEKNMELACAVDLLVILGVEAGRCDEFGMRGPVGEIQYEDGRLLEMVSGAETKALPSLVSGVLLMKHSIREIKSTELESVLVQLDINWDQLKLYQQESWRRITLVCACRMILNMRLGGSCPPINLVPS